ncbi:MAG: RraA family protein [Hyphomicrobiaceae bacterium]
MLHNPPLLTIHRGFDRPDPKLVVKFKGAQTSHLTDAMDGRGALDYRIKPLDASQSVFAGPAMTAHSYPADIIGMFGAVSEAQPGDVIVVANDSYTETAVVGDLAVGMMRNKGVAAFVTDGLARDKAGILATGVPVFSRGISPNSPGCYGQGTVGVPVTLGGVHVSPGDIIVGDEDAVVVVPLARAEEIAERLAEIRAAEAKTEVLVAEGMTMSPRMVDIINNAVIVEN